MFWQDYPDPTPPAPPPARIPYLRLGGGLPLDVYAGGLDAMRAAVRAESARASVTLFPDEIERWLGAPAAGR